MNRHYPQSIKEVWESYEYLLKQRLEQMDHLAREMYKEMAMLRSAKPALIREFMELEFAKLWEQVAEEQEGGRKGERIRIPQSAQR